MDLRRTDRHTHRQTDLLPCHSFGHTNLISPCAEQRLWSLFQEIDVDSAGEIDSEQVDQLLQNMGAELTEAELDMAMAEMDVEGTGLIDFGTIFNTYGRRFTLILAY